MMLYGIRMRATPSGYREWYDRGSCRWCARTIGPFEIYWSPGRGWEDQAMQHAVGALIVGVCIWHPVFIPFVIVGVLIAAALP